jgi:Fibronectin type III domain
MKRRLWCHSLAYAVALASLLTSSLVALQAGAATPGTPSAPRAVHASGDATSISVKWLRPTSRGAAPIREYVVKSKPTARSCVTRTTTCVVKGLKPGLSYTFSVTARNGRGASVPSSSNRIRVATARTYFGTQLAILNETSSLAETAITNAQTSSQEQKGVDELTGSFDLFIGSLKLEKWPSGTAADMANFINDTSQLATDTIASLEASSASVAEDLDVLQGASTKDLLGEGNVLTDLGFLSPIDPPITTTPTAAALNAAQTIHDLYGDVFSVTATQLVDPATAAAGSGLPDSGYRFVAVELTLVNSGTTATIEGNANYSATVLGSDGQTYSADYGTVAECANFDSGDFQLPPSDSVTGCVVFELPTSVTVQSVEFTLAPNYLDTAEWDS